MSSLISIKFCEINIIGNELQAVYYSKQFVSNNGK